MFNTKPDTAELQSTVVKLDTLYTSFNTLLESAQNQLETLSLQESDYQRLFKTALDNKEFSAALIEKITSSVLLAITEDSENKISQAIADKVTAQVIERSKETLTDSLNVLYNEVLSSNVFEDAVTRKISEHAQIQEAFTISEGLKALISKANTTNESHQGTTE